MSYLKRINDVITDNDISIKELAKYLNKNYSNTIKMLKEEGRYFSIEDLIKICELTNTSPEYILEFIDEPKKIK